AALVPLAAILAAAPQVGHGIDAPQLEPLDIADAKARRQRDVEAAVAEQDRRIAAVELEPLAADDDHRHARAVFALVKDLSRLELPRIESDFWLAEKRAPAAFDV